MEDNDRLVYAGEMYMPFRHVLPHLAMQGIEDICLADKGTGIHVSDFCTGIFEGNRVAIKFGRPLFIYQHEAEGLKLLSHEGVPRFHALGEMSVGKSKFGYLAIQYFEGDPLRKCTDLATDEGRARFARRMLSLLDVMDYMHSKNVMHNDITPNHILARQDGVALIDFHLWEEAYAPIYDFCGHDYYPSVFLNEIQSKHRLISHDEVEEWKPRSLGKFLVDIAIPYDNPYAAELRNLGQNLVGKSEKFRNKPKARDFLSNKIRQKFENLNR